MTTKKNLSKRPKVKDVGRNKVAINWDSVNRMLTAHCTGTSIATKFGIHPNTLYNRVKDEFGMDFEEYARQRREEGKDMLRLKQFEMAIKGDKSMLIWLGKQLLGQSDKVENKDELTIKEVEIKEVVVVRRKES